MYLDFGFVAREVSTWNPPLEQNIQLLKGPPSGLGKTQKAVYSTQQTRPCEEEPQFALPIPLVLVHGVGNDNREDN